MAAEMNSMATTACENSLLLILQLPIFRSDGQLFIDTQAHNGLHRWLDNFDRMTVCLPVVDIAVEPAGTSPLKDSDYQGRCRVICLPDTRSLTGFLRALPAVTRVIDEQIDTHGYLCFALGGLFGDWASYAGLRASSKNRRFSVWTDRVESQVIKFHSRQSKGIKKYYWNIISVLMTHYERLVIKKSTLGLFHGADCFDAYAAYSRNPNIVHDIHLKSSDKISMVEMMEKVKRKTSALKIMYAGRAHVDKGIFDWIDTLVLLDRGNVEFSASWYGDGPELAAARNAVSVAGLGHRIAFPGAIDDRGKLLAEMRDADLFVFCHKTPESPRCLIEALISGTPIVGYASAYPRDLISGNSGGRLVEHSPEALCEEIKALANDRLTLSELVQSAAADGYYFNDVEVFRHRSDLMKSAG